ncbi:peptidase M18 aminopeptidase I [Coriobacterium glomerans PW2]|uniref:M18 family aminopeptidase n=1 Tax=Coriobacterium glomerans (strain ATCC 49209 / DSM 20642 / JCM 10262 / PW2) TaxID=700015 RepID=F2N8D0_CORGP|nr:aminopeptidase [Coriobacterium glomerans]AEB07313.1 peptidase M18 aminopeptidase I [Coriobacterium glomerans PW2]
MERTCAWLGYDRDDLDEIDRLSEAYRSFLSECKTERLCVRRGVELARSAGYIALDEALASGGIKPGDRVYAVNHGKALMLANIGSAPLERGFSILGAHIDSPRLDLKQNPLFQAGDLAYLDTHYYGGVKPYHWVATPLALVGVVAKRDGTLVDINVGDRAGDPVFTISDLLIHLASEQMSKPAKEAVEAENLDVIVGGRPADDTAGETDGSSGSDAAAATGEEAVSRRLLDILRETYDIEEEDLLSAEIEVVPAGPAREMGLDRSMILGYGQDDRVCAYTSLAAQLAVESVERTSICLLTDKEEIGSVGASGMTSRFFENTVAEIMTAAGETGPLAVRRALERSRMLSSDVSAGFDAAYASRFEKRNAAFLGRGLCFNKYTGARGKFGCNDADAEYMALLRDIMDEAGVRFQTCELGRVDAGGGGTIAYILAEYGMDVIDAGVPVLSMHALWEVASKADIYEAYKGYQAFLRRG